MKSPILKYLVVIAETDNFNEYIEVAIRCIPAIKIYLSFCCRKLIWNHDLMRVRPVDSVIELLGKKVRLREILDKQLKGLYHHIYVKFERGYK